MTMIFSMSSGLSAITLRALNTLCACVVCVCVWCVCVRCVVCGVCVCVCVCKIIINEPNDPVEPLLSVAIVSDTIL